MTDKKAPQSGIKPPPKKKDLGLDMAPPPPVTAKPDGKLVPLCFKVDPEFKRDFTVFAAQNDLKLVELLRAAVNDYMGKRS